MLALFMNNIAKKQHFRQPVWHGRRKGHKLTNYRQHLLMEMLPTLSLTISKKTKGLQINDVFPSRPLEIWFEIGFGDGAHLAKQAILNPEVGIVGFEPFINGVAALLSRIKKSNISNVRIFPDDARLALNYIPKSSISKIFILFSDPWPKRRHHRRRFIQHDTVELLANILVDGGKVVFASDCKNYVRWTLEKLHNHCSFQWSAECLSDWAAQPADWISTRYEKKALQKGEKPVYLIFTRKPRT